MTEDEAKTKWCPFARVTNLDGNEAASNRWETADCDDDSGLQPGSYCIGSACMAWRTLPHAHDEKPPGYCGLAGKP